MKRQCVCARPAPTPDLEIKALAVVLSHWVEPSTRARWQNRDILLLRFIKHHVRVQQILWTTPNVGRIYWRRRKLMFVFYKFKPVGITYGW
jgi:hypothetical protein